MYRDRVGSTHRHSPDLTDVEPVELVDDSSADDVLEQPPLRRLVPGRRMIAVVGVAALAAVALVVAIAVRSRDDHPHPAAIASSQPVSSAAPAVPRTRPAVVVTHLDRPMVGAVRGWELFARGPQAVVRIEPARNRVTTTAVPTLTSDGPVGFVAAADRVFVRPADAVPGYVIVDGQAPRPLREVNLQAGYVFPGPDRHHLWVENLDGDRLILVNLQGRPSGPAVPAAAYLAHPDSTGYLVIVAIGDVYDGGPLGLRRVTTGDLLAVGPTRWLVHECDARHRCATVVIDRATGARRAVGAARTDFLETIGQISPDGTTAALVVGGARPRLELIDLGSGRRRVVDLGSPGGSGPAGDVVWSPDSGSLFVLNTAGRIIVVDRQARARPLAITLPPLTQLAFRSPRALSGARDHDRG